jgi:hypothetical protein
MSSYHCKGAISRDFEETVMSHLQRYIPLSLGVGEDSFVEVQEGLHLGFVGMSRYSNHSAEVSS